MIVSLVLFNKDNNKCITTLATSNYELMSIICSSTLITHLVFIVVLCYRYVIDLYLLKVRMSNKENSAYMKACDYLKIPTAPESLHYILNIDSPILIGFFAIPFWRQYGPTFLICRFLRRASFQGSLEPSSREKQKLYSQAIKIFTTASEHSTVFICS
ncbi:hypothetical protein H8356DRAFT_1379188 [Neocallimastix lanati (nom. inval.)]|nr:hypothetical protein H8356DRAFT_1379188 [Neocallimastix sp. JGI-2020a]